MPKEQAFEEEGFDVINCPDGEIAWEQYLKKQPDICLLDVNMPEVDGFETAKWVYERFPHIKILALSMYSDEATVIKMLRNGAKGFVLKNADPEKLKEALDSIVEKDFYLSDFVSGKILSGLHKNVDVEKDEITLSNKISK